MIKESVAIAIVLLLWENFAESFRISQNMIGSSSEELSPGAAAASSLTTTTTLAANPYRLFVEEPRNFTEAKEACVSKGGHLATILSEAEQAQVEEEVAGNKGDAIYSAWIGLEQTARWQYTWVNNDVMTIDSNGDATAGYGNFPTSSNSASQFDISSRDTEDCISLSLNDYIWRDEECSRETPTYLCKMVPL